jgi:hypothetical protein
LDALGALAGFGALTGFGALAGAPLTALALAGLGVALAPPDVARAGLSW